MGVFSKTEAPNISSYIMELNLTRNFYLQPSSGHNFPWFDTLAIAGFGNNLNCCPFTTVAKAEILPSSKYPLLSFQANVYFISLLPVFRDLLHSQFESRQVIIWTNYSHSLVYKSITRKLLENVGSWNSPPKIQITDGGSWNLQSNKGPRGFCCSDLKTSF